MGHTKYVLPASGTVLGFIGDRQDSETLIIMLRPVADIQLI